MSPPSKSLARRVPVEVESIALVVYDCEGSASLCRLASRQRALISLTNQGPSLDPNRERAKPILGIGSYREGEHLCLVWSCSRHHSYNDGVLLRTQNHRIRLPSQVTSAMVADSFFHLTSGCDFRSSLSATLVLVACALADATKVATTNKIFGNFTLHTSARALLEPNLLPCRH